MSLDICNTDWPMTVASEVGDDHQHFMRAEHFPKEDELSFFMDIGSMFSFVDEESDHEIIKGILATVERICSDHWWWTLDEFTVFSPDDQGKSILPDGKKAKVVDLRRHLWINFASRDDAMLSRITLTDLRSGRHVERGRCA